MSRRNWTEPQSLFLRKVIRYVLFCVVSGSLILGRQTGKKKRLLATAEPKQARGLLVAWCKMEQFLDKFFQIVYSMQEHEKNISYFNLKLKIDVLTNTTY